MTADGSHAVPGRLNLKQALRAYVHGHDRGWEAGRKAELAAAGDDGEDGGSFAGAGPPLGREGRRYGIPVPETLDFHRGADTWRDRIPRPERSRRPAGWSGEDSGEGPGDGDERRRE